MIQPDMKSRIKERIKALEARLAERYERCVVAERNGFRAPNGRIVALDAIAAFGALVIEHAENQQEAELNRFEDGDLFYLEDMDEETMFQAMLREIEG